jgi:hypothetical protein
VKSDQFRYMSYGKVDIRGIPHTMATIACKANLYRSCCFKTESRNWKGRVVTVSITILNEMLRWPELKMHIERSCGAQSRHIYDRYTWAHFTIYSSHNLD